MIASDDLKDWYAAVLNIEKAASFKIADYIQAQTAPDGGNVIVLKQA